MVKHEHVVDLADPVLIEPRITAHKEAGEADIQVGVIGACEMDAVHGEGDGGPIIPDGNKIIGSTRCRSGSAVQDTGASKGRITRATATGIEPEGAVEPSIVMAQYFGETAVAGASPYKCTHGQVWHDRTANVEGQADHICRTGNGDKVSRNTAVYALARCCEANARAKGAVIAIATAIVCIAALKIIVADQSS